MKRLLEMMRLQVAVNRERTQRGYFVDQRSEVVYEVLPALYDVETQEGRTQVNKFFDMAEKIARRA